MAAMLAGLAAVWSTGCSTVPPQAWPAHDSRCVVCTYPSDDGPIELPASDPHLTVLELVVEPPWRREFFEDGRRFVEPDPDSPYVVLRCRYRAYQNGGDAPPAPEALFPGAATIRDVPQP